MAWPWTALLLSACLVGCASEQRELNLVEPSLDRLPPLSCQVELVTLRDSVGDRAMVGFGGHSYSVQGFAERIERQVQLWRSSALYTDRTLPLSLELSRAYPRLTQSETHFHSVLLVDQPGQEPAVMRGHHRVTNWFASEAAFSRAAERSMDEALMALHAWIRAQCRALNRDLQSDGSGNPA